jgi:hypothetical protein
MTGSLQSGTTRRCALAGEMGLTSARRETCRDESRRRGIADRDIEHFSVISALRPEERGVHMDIMTPRDHDYD